MASKFVTCCAAVLSVRQPAGGDVEACELAPLADILALFWRALREANGF